MTDKKWLSLMHRCQKAQWKYLTLLRQIEREYKERYSVYPSEVDDDNWIDLFHYGQGEFADLEEVKQSAEIRRKTEFSPR